ncbi:hypothetical protein ACP4OV_012197 [Aristida adscensionis]
MAMAGLIHKLLALAVAAMAMAAVPASGQLPVPLLPVPASAVSCTTSLVTSFGPCLNFITNNSASPTADCCRSLGALVNASAGCACAILTGSVPLGVPVNRTLGATLPRACNSASVALLCRDASSAQTPAPGPVAETPSLPPLPPVTPAAPVTPATPEPEAPVPPVEPTAAAAPVSQGQSRPTVVPSAGRRAADDHLPATAAFVLLLAMAGTLA